ncbi:MAG: hypothetical protein GY931_19665 [Maribacter sp.]|nr:hypothetical protein [Maribacter sp.]
MSFSFGDLFLILVASYVLFNVIVLQDVVPAAQEDLLLTAQEDLLLKLVATIVLCHIPVIQDLVPAA